MLQIYTLAGLDKMNLALFSHFPIIAYTHRIARYSCLRLGSFSSSLRFSTRSSTRKELFWEERGEEGRGEGVGEEEREKGGKVESGRKGEGMRGGEGRSRDK